MNTVAITAFKTLLTDTLDRQGWTMPMPLINYTVSILAEKLDKNPWQPEPSYAEQWMTIRTAEQALALGNTCWFTRAVFPELMQRRGIASSYYVDLGQGCYDRVLRGSYIDLPTVRAMRDHFEFTAEIALTAIRSEGGFRSMWE